MTRAIEAISTGRYPDANVSRAVETKVDERRETRPI
jgi:hypothetical protein